MADDFNYEYNQDGGRDSADALRSWIPTIIMMFCFFPVGICMLIYKLFGFAGNKKTATRHPYDIEHGYTRQGGGAREQFRRRADAAAEGARRDINAAADEICREAKVAADEIRREAKNVAREAKSAAESVAREARTAGKAAGYQAAERASGYHSAGQNTSKKAKQKKAAAHKESEAGQGLMVGGTITAAIAGFIAFVDFMEVVGYGGLPALFSGIGMEEVFLPLGICGAGLVMLYYGVQKRKKMRRYRKYLALVGRRESISVISLAQAMGVSVHRACDDLQDMLDEGIIPVGFLDMGSGRLILNGEGLRDEPTPEPARPAAEPEAPRGMEREDQALLEIRNLNDAIADEEMSGKIDRIGEITGKIFAYLRVKPDKEGQLRSFLSYYLPTTLKILRAYAQMESQGIEGENITSAKERIEGMMDKVVDGFEKQLDKLFQDDAMDITTDVAVLERMLDKDGLGGGQGMTLGGL